MSNDVVKSMQAQIDALKAQLAQAQAAAQAKVSLKVSEKGAVSLYGLGRFPVTLYAGQWVTVLNMATTIQDFIRANADKLATKATAKAA